MLKINKFRLNDWLRIFFVVISMVIIIDFILPGKSLTEPIVTVKKELQRYYNAARNSHYSYRLFTNTRNFNISESFAAKIDSAELVNYYLSPVFNEVNSYSTFKFGNKNMYSLRVFSGLIFPLMCIIVMIIALKYKNKVAVISFVFQILLIANFVYLIV